jgi:hypothetical protein
VGKPLRIALVVLGLAVAVYGVASLTGGWLGAPPWSVVTVGVYTINGAPRYQEHDPVHDPRPADAWWASGVILAGLALSTFAAWPRRAKPTPPA